MAIALHTVSGGTVAAEDDARLYAKLTGSAGGVVEGGVCTASGGLVVHLTAGWGIACGRIFSWDAENITVAGSGSGTKEGRLKIVIDLTDPDDPIGIESEVATTLPALVQQDLNASGTMYEIALATYTVSTTAASDLVSNTPVRIVPANRNDAVPNTRTVNSKALSSDITLAASDVGAVPTTRTVNSKALSSNITIGRSDIAGIVLSNQANTSKTLTMSLSGTTLTITYN